MSDKASIEPGRVFKVSNGETEVFGRVLDGARHGPGYFTASIRGADGETQTLHLQADDPEAALALFEGQPEHPLAFLGGERQQPSERAPGYYWLREIERERRLVAHFDGQFWTFTSSTHVVADDDLDEDDELEMARFDIGPRVDEPTSWP